MNYFIRKILPVGQGGFAFESIDNYSIVFDCGSSTAPKRVSEYIHQLQIKYTEINQLYLSHFDKDHVSGIKELLETVRVKEAVVPLIPIEFRTAYNAITRSAYSSIMSMFRENDVKVSEIGEENKVNRMGIWEWIAKPMISINEWCILMEELELKGFEISQLQDPVYVDSHKKAINDCFKSIFGAYGPNSKGLIMLSQITTDAIKYRDN